MGRGKSLSLHEREQILAMHAADSSVKDIALAMGRSANAVRSFLNDPDGYHRKRDSLAGQIRSELPVAPLGVRDDVVERDTSNNNNSNENPTSSKRRRLRASVGEETDVHNTAAVNGINELQQTAVEQPITVSPMDSYRTLNRFGDAEDYLLVECVHADTPYTAKHGHRMAAWDAVAQKLAHHPSIQRKFPNLKGTTAKARFDALVVQHRKWRARAPRRHPEGESDFSKLMDEVLAQMDGKRSGPTSTTSNNAPAILPRRSISETQTPNGTITTVRDDNRRQLNGPLSTNPTTVENGDVLRTVMAEMSNNLVTLLETQHRFALEERETQLRFEREEREKDRQAQMQMMMEMTTSLMKHTSEVTLAAIEAGRKRKASTDSNDRHTRSDGGM